MSATSCPMTISSIILSQTPMPFLSPIPLQISFYCNPIPHPLEWRIIYIGSAADEQFDQVLQEFQIGPITEGGEMKFELECQPPDAARLPLREIIAVTALVLTVSYKGQEFIRVGYYVHNVLDQQKMKEKIMVETENKGHNQVNAQRIGGISVKQQISFANYYKNKGNVNNANLNGTNLESNQKIALPLMNAKNINSFLPHINRIILSSKPRITRFAIDWRMPEQKEANIPQESNLSGPQKISTQQQIDLH